MVRGETNAPSAVRAASPDGSGTHLSTAFALNGADFPRPAALALLSFVPVRLLIAPVAGSGWPFERVFGIVASISPYYYERQVG